MANKATRYTMTSKGEWTIHIPDINFLYHYWMKKEKRHEKFIKNNKELAKENRKNSKEKST